MSGRRVGVVTFPGSNCDADFRQAVNRTPGLTAVALWHKDADLQGVDAVVLPGGFSYGDYLRCGAIARFSPIMWEIVRFAEAGGPVLGVCNGFQILCEARLLPGVLRPNIGRKFVCKDVLIRCGRTDTPWTRRVGTAVFRLPIAHGEGAWTAPEAVVAACEASGQLLFRYVSADGELDPQANPNGALLNVAGVCNERGNVVGLMPHPERSVEAALGGADGAAFLNSLVEALG